MTPEQKELVENHFQLVEILVDKALSHPSHRHLRSYRNDLIGEGSIALVKCAYTFEPERGLKFATYCSKRIKGYILNFINRKLYPISNLECDIDLVDPNEFAYYEEEADVKEPERKKIDVHKYAPKSSVSQRAVYYRVILEGESIKTVAEDLGLAVGTIKSIKARLLKKLRMEKENYGKV